jgi:phospholipid-transporting ATPase
MEFKFCTIGTYRFGDRRLMMDVDYSRTPVHTDDVLNYTFDDAEIKQAIISEETIGDLAEPLSSKGQLIKRFLQAMALTHELLVEHDEEGRAKYNGSSPDEVTLVDAARRIGVKYLGAQHSTLHIAFDTSDVPELQLLEHRENVVEFERLVLIEFNSVRKRNSVILRSTKNNEILLLTKGADNVILPKLAHSSDDPIVKKVKDDLESYANEGYRTLVYAFRVIEQEVYDEWKAEYDKALDAIGDREKEVGLVAEKIEVALTLLGCTAVEDRLQDEVPDTIHDLQEAGIKIWMLTGDKLGTAVNVGRSCRLLEDNMEVLECRELPIEECLERFKEIASKINSIMNDKGSQKKIGLCIEGASIDFIFYDNDDLDKRLQYPHISQRPELIQMAAEMKRIFIDFAVDCHSVIVCRATPKQKQETVKLMKSSFGTITLSIGDGANDVPMIMEAHIGIGLYGEEGMQAVQASDYAVGEFRFLWDLVLAHGHWNYIRQSEMILYFFYKNFLFTFCHFIYSFFTASSGRTVHDDWYISFYNLFFTALPLMIRALFETDIDLPRRSNDPEVKRKRKEFTKLYAVGQKNQIFTDTAFVWWVFKGLVHAIMVFFFTYTALHSGILTPDGKNTDLWAFSIIECTCIVFVVNLELALHVRSWSWLVIVSIGVFSLGIYIAFIFVYDFFQLTSAYSSMLQIAVSPALYLCLVLTLSFSLVTTGAVRIFSQILAISSK